MLPPGPYNSKEHEEKIYQLWEKSGYFNPDNLPIEKDAPVFSLAMPPVNVTGVLHLGHALENALMDIEIRYQRMQGKRAVIIPGTDHAAVATQAKVEKELVKSGQYKNPRAELGREKLLTLIKDYAEKSQKTILEQIKKMGTSCDWSRLAYTFDDKREKAVNEMFIKMYNDGLIYRGYRVVNWSVKGQSTCSDDELVYQEQSGKLYTFKYSADFPITIATTRPETKLGDTAVAVNPNDERYKKYIGQTFQVDVGAAKPLAIKIIGDEIVDPEYGTGALGVTPAHSQIDFELKEKHNLELIPVIDNFGRMTEAAGKNYAGLKVLAAREKFIDWLKENNLFIKEEDIPQNVGTSDRFGDVVEAIPMLQWFVSVNKKIPGKNKSLKDLMKEAFTTGLNNDPKQKIKITPERFEKSYFNWIDNLRDWCISRQIWFGHRIPVYYHKQEIYVGDKPPKGGDWEQDPDTLDTWFSSGLWTFSTLGWPEKTEDLKKFHPTSWMQMGYEILFFWMARMILMSTYALEEIPFKEVYIHGMLRNKSGQKFSKSLGIGIDPREVCDKHGTDALRLSLIFGVTPGNDSKFYEEKIIGFKRFANKIWNASKFVLNNLGNDFSSTLATPVASDPADQTILAALNEATKSVTRNLDNYMFHEAAQDAYQFFWHDFCDVYIEAVKDRLNGADEKSKKAAQEILFYVLITSLKLLHPFIPFITETIYQSLPVKKSDLLMVERWPIIK
ncbi:MAG TPA: valine--tRNA ligase [bacterium]|nr:valine--tRNA ligase [bacterium]HPL95548.1 valine--tRNA ligase [bacterium]